MWACIVPTCVQQCLKHMAVTKDGSAPHCRVRGPRRCTGGGSFPEEVQNHREVPSLGGVDQRAPPLRVRRSQRGSTLHPGLNLVQVPPLAGAEEVGVSHAL